MSTYVKKEKLYVQCTYFLHDFSCYEKVEGLSYLIFQCCFFSISVRTLSKEPSEIQLAQDISGLPIKSKEKKVLQPLIHKKPAFLIPNSF